MKFKDMPEWVLLTQITIVIIIVCLVAGAILNWRWLWDNLAFVWCAIYVAWRVVWWIWSMFT